jgi:arylsulfatase A-like enzyme/Tfp pilus assembly protein PilF
MQKRLAVVALLVAIGVVIHPWWRTPRSEAQARARLLHLHPAPSTLNVVIVTLDTTRADRLGCYGATSVETPNLDGLAREGVLFEQATATVPLTFPSHSAIFTGLVPPHHGVHDNGGFFLDESRTTLAERFRGAGYATGAFIAAWVLDSKWGLAQGFDTYADKFDLSKYKVVSLGTVQKPGDEVMDEALAWMDGVRDRRFLSWIHLYDPHSPYEAPEPFRSRYKGQPYLAEIAYTDQVVGRLLGWLREKKLLERTIVVVTADHGEALGDHGESTHSYYIYDSTTHVPLIIRTPWRLRGRSHTQVGSVDLMPTILDLAGLPPQAGIDGRSLALALFDPAAELGHVSYSETYYPRFHYGWQHLRSLRDGRYKFIEAPTPELYDIAADPGETTNIYKAFSRRAEGLRARLHALAGETTAQAPEQKQLDPETLQRLAALGYVGNAVDVDPTAVLPDPKDKIGLYKMMHAARDLAQEERYAEAVSVMRKVVAEDPDIIDAYISLGNWLMRSKRGDEAIAAFQQVLSRQPDNSLAIVNLANVYRVRGQHDAAIEGYRTALKLDPKNPQNWFQLATLFLDLGRVHDAEATFREALKANPKMGAAYNSLGVIAWSRGQKDEAERLFRQGLELEPDLAGGRVNLARVLEARGDLGGAERLYREELEIYADSGKARFNLAQLLRQRGDREGYLAELQLSIEKAPEFGPAFFFLAREELAAGGLTGAEELARRGLEVDPRSDVAPLGHYVLADVYSRRGERAKAAAEAGAARSLETSLAARRRPNL